MKVKSYIVIFHFLFHYGLSQDSEYDSLCCTVGPCCLSQYCKAITLQLKINNNNNKKDGTRQREHGQEGKVRGQGRNRKSPWPVQASLQPCSPALTPLPPHPCLLSLLRKERQARRDQKEGRKQKMYKEKMGKKKLPAKEKVLMIFALL